MVHEFTDYERFERESEENRRLLRQEELILHVTNSLSEMLDKEAISKTDLAKRLGKSKGFVSQVLAGDRNLTLRTIADIATALGAEIRLEVSKARPQESNVLRMCAPGPVHGIRWNFPHPPVIRSDGRKVRAFPVEAMEQQGAAA